MSDSRTRVCWNCGYALDGLPLPGACPECGVGQGDAWSERERKRLIGDRTDRRALIIFVVAVGLFALSVATCG